MLSKTLLLVLAFGTVVMWGPIFLICRSYRIKSWKSIPIAVLLTIAGTIGTYILYFIENGQTGGRSFYGAVFLVPIFFIPISYLFRVSYVELLDACAPAECVMLAIMKIQCMMDGCCEGRIIYTLSDGIEVRFPSQAVEFVGAILVFTILMNWGVKHEKKGSLYTWYLLLYGSSRFVLNFFRAAWENVNQTIPIGTVWSLVAVVMGMAILFISQNEKRKKNGEKCV